MHPSYSSRALDGCAAQVVRRRVPLVLPLLVPAVILSSSGASRTANLTSPHSPAVSTSGPDLPYIVPSDNRRRAGKLENGVLTIRLDARTGMWYPEGKKGIGLTVAAFAEEGRAAQNPGPLIRVPVGTEVRAFVRNSLAKPLTLFGLGAERGLAADSFMVDPGAVREVRFVASTAGTFYYVGKTTKGRPLGRLGEDSQLNGVIVVDSAGAPATPNDRIFSIGWWATLDPKSPSGFERATLVINGRSWPHTERLDVAQGDSLSWRWVNFTEIPHPMHLHGFYFRVDAVGNGASYTAYAPDARRQAVTEVVGPGGTMALAWSPNRPGNWVFHCHFVGHISHHVALGTRNGVAAAASPHAHAGRGGHETHQMAGLVLGIRVAPRGMATTKIDGDYRAMRLLVRSKPNVYGTEPGYAYVLGGTPAERDSNTLTLPGPTLVLQKDEPVAITIVNQSHMPAAVHWHGIELESFPDGVPGWSGSGSNTLPMIASGDSLTVRFTPPRAGTFMYHSHSNEFQQIASGLYGAIVVVEPGTTPDPERDQVLLFSDGGPTVFLLGNYPPTLLNGKRDADPITLPAGVPTRLRLINIRTDFILDVALLDGDQPAEWRLVAKDGAALPASQLRDGEAKLMISPGEIYDVLVTATARRTLTFTHQVRGDSAAVRVPVRVQ